MNEEGEGVWLVELAPEVMHKVALSGWLEFEDVKALSQTCTRMKSIFLDDDYGRDIHYALIGVVENVRGKRWRSALYAVRRKWFVEGKEEEESVWREVAKAAVGRERTKLENDGDLVGWENVMLATLSLPGASGWAEMWNYTNARNAVRKTSVLHIAGENGSERVVDWVMERGGDLEGRDWAGSTPLWIACECGRLGLVRKLVESGADVTTKNRYSLSVLAAASYGGHADVVAYLLGLGVLDVGAEGYGRSSSLHGACVGSHTDVVKLLVEGGANVDVEGRSKYGPMSFACLCGNAEIVRLLVNAGAWSGVGKDEEEWVKLLMKAAEKGHVEVVRLLVEMGVDGVDGVGNTALGLASRHGNVDIVRVLVGEGGADVDKAGEEGTTPLIWASREGKMDVVRLLLELGADVGVRDDKCETALDVARRGGWDDIVEMLESWGSGQGGE